MTAARAAGLAIAALAAAMLAACAVQEVSVADLELDLGSGPRPRRCRNNSECRPNEFCANNACGQGGMCLLRPLVCDAVAQPVCGCDGVTYWNDCIRSRSGVSAANPGECTSTAANCTDPSACPVAGASCARLLPSLSACASPPDGNCWMLPTDCSAANTSEVWTSCADPALCDSTCAAIRSGSDHVRAAGATCP